MLFNEKTSPKGHLEIWKQYADGTKELHYSDDNVICSGMGWTLSEFFTAPLQEPIDKYQLTYFQVGISGSSALQVSSTGELSANLTLDQYGTGYLDLSQHTLWNNGTTTPGEVFGVIPYAYIRKITDTKVLYQIVLDQASCNIGEDPGGIPLNEIGLFAKNPFHGTVSPEQSVLVAYRYFKPIYKTDAITLIFRWSIDF
jgi:hypothetical protein